VTPLRGELARLAVALGAAAVAAPFCLGIVRCAAALARTLAADVFPSVQGRADLADAPRRALVLTLELAVLLAVGVPLVAVTQPFLPRFPGAAVLAGGILLLGLALWRSVANLQQHARAGAQAIVEVLARQLRSREAAAGATAERAESELEGLHRLLPGLGAPEPVRIGPDTLAAGRTLAELDLRGRTGATVLAIVRDQAGVLTPTGHETLEVGDLLAVAGTEEAVESAREQLSRPAAGAQPGEAGAAERNRGYPSREEEAS
jgi:CPA2 family monovalent cation:H+ antiporter-2